MATKTKNPNREQWVPGEEDEDVIDAYVGDDADDDGWDDEAFDDEHNPLDLLTGRDRGAEPEEEEEEPEEPPKKTRRTVRTSAPDGSKTTVVTETATPPKAKPAKKPAPPKNALDLLSGGDDDTVYVIRTGPQTYRGQEVQCADCGHLPASASDLKSEIKKRWGGGDYEVKGYNSAGKPVTVPIKIAGKPKDIEDDPPEPFSGPYGRPVAPWQRAATPFPYAGSGGSAYNYGGFPGAPGANFYPFPPGSSAADDDDETEDTEKAELRAKLEAFQAASQDRQFQMMQQAGERSEKTLGLMLQQMMAQQAGERDKWEREFRERQLQQQRERDEAERRWREERDRQDREWRERRDEERRQREEEQIRRREEADKEQKRLDRERELFEQRRREENDRAERQRQEDNKRSEERLKEQEKFFERLTRVQQGNAQNADKMLTMLSGFLEVAQKARDMVTGEEDPTTAKWNMVKDVVSTGFNALKGGGLVGGAPGGAPGQPQAVPLQQIDPQQAAALQQQAAQVEAVEQAVNMGQLVPVRAPDGTQHLITYQQAVEGGLLPPPAPLQQGTVPQQPQAASQQPPLNPEEEAKRYGDLLNGFVKAIDNNDPPHWSIGRLQDFPEVLERLRQVDDAETLTMLLEVQAAGDVPAALREPLERFIKASKSIAGKQWINDLLDVVAGDEDEDEDGDDDGGDTPSTPPAPSEPTSAPVTPSAVPSST